MNHIKIRTEGTDVVLILDGKRIATMPYQTADELQRAIYIKAREAEELDKAYQVIEDGAWLMRMGIPIGFTDNSKMRQEIAKMAVYDKRLRKYLPKMQGVKSKESFGAPSLKEK